MLFLRKKQEVVHQHQKIPKCDVACKQCGSLEFTYYGVSKIGIVYMAGYRCNQCNNGLALEISELDYINYCKNQQEIANVNAKTPKLLNINS